MEGDPGSPSAFRFIMDLREDGGDEAEGNTSEYKYCRNMIRLVMVQEFSDVLFRPVTCLRAFLCLHGLC